MIKTCKSQLHTYVVTSSKTSLRGCPECRKAYEYGYVRKNRQKMLLNSNNWKAANPDKVKETQKLYRINSSNKVNAKNKKRQCAKLNRTPSWLTIEQVIEMQHFYKIAKNLTQIQGIRFEVDHIIPINGVNVSGLHVPWNLQVITKTANIKKSNNT